MSSSTSARHHALLRLVQEARKVYQHGEEQPQPKTSSPQDLDAKSSLSFAARGRRSEHPKRGLKPFQAGVGRRARRFALAASTTYLAGVVACSGSEPSIVVDGEQPHDPGAFDGGSGAEGGSGPGPSGGEAGLDGASVTEGGTDGGAPPPPPPPPPPPVVGTVTGFALVLSIPALDLACTTTDCYAAAGTTGLWKLANGASVQSALPTLPWADPLGTSNVTTSGNNVFALFEHGQAAMPTTQLLSLASGGWTPIGAPGLLLNDSSLSTDGQTVFAGVRSVAGGGFAFVAAGGGSSASWTAMPFPFANTDNGGYPASDANGTLWGIDLKVPRLPVRRPLGAAAWSIAGAGWSKTFGYGRRLRVAYNGDVWVSGTGFVARLAAGASDWVSIALPPGNGETSGVVIDGDNTAYFTFGTPQTGKLMKVAPNGTTALDMGVTVSATRPCGPAAIDGTGRLLFSCFQGGTANTPGGLYRSTP